MIRTSSAEITQDEARFQMTPGRKSQVFAGIQECERLIALEMRFPSDLRNNENLSRYETMKKRLIGYLDEAEKTGWFTSQF